MRVDVLAIPEIKLVTPSRFGDSRGYFCEVYNQSRFDAHGIGPFIQDNQSLSVATGTIRGLHCQLAPHAQGKLVRCIKGAIWDVAIDIRTGSSTYAQHVAAILSAANGSQLWIPPGFLHGFCTIEPDSEVLYKVTASYNRDAERAIRWDDPTLAVPWPVQPGCAQLSDKDYQAPELHASKGWFGTEPYR